MTKVKLTEATKEINQQAGVILEEAARIRRNIENVLQTLRKQESKFHREEEEERAKPALPVAEAVGDEDVDVDFSLDDDLDDFDMDLSDDLSAIDFDDDQPEEEE